MQSRAAMVLRPGQEYSLYLPLTLKLCVHILNGLFGALKIYATGAHTFMASPTARLCMYII